MRENNYILSLGMIKISSDSHPMKPFSHPGVHLLWELCHHCDYFKVPLNVWTGLVLKGSFKRFTNIEKEVTGLDCINFVCWLQHNKVGYKNKFAY